MLSIVNDSNNILTFISEKIELLDGGTNSYSSFKILYVL